VDAGDEETGTSAVEQDADEGILLEVAGVVALTTTRIFSMREPPPPDQYLFCSFFLFFSPSESEELMERPQSFASDQTLLLCLRLSK